MRIGRLKSMKEQEALIQNMLQVNEVDKIVDMMWESHSVPKIAIHLSNLLGVSIDCRWVWSIHQRTSKAKAGGEKHV